MSWHLSAKIEELKSKWIEESRKLESLQHLQPERFQELMWILFKNLGWKVEETPFSQDGGVDGLLTKGTTTMVLQCKRYKGNIGEPTMRDLYGTYSHRKANGAILVTTGRISLPARKFAVGKNIEWYDGEGLLSLLATAGITTEQIPDSFVAEDLLPLYGEKLRRIEAEKNKIVREIMSKNCPRCGVGKLEFRRGRRGLFMRCSKCDYGTHEFIR